MPSHAQQQQQQPQQDRQPTPDGRVLSDSTLVVIVCSIFAGFVGAIFIACLLRAVCRDLPAKLRAWRRRRRRDWRSDDDRRYHGNHDGLANNCSGPATVGEPTTPVPAAPSTAAEAAGSQEFGVMLMHTRQASVDVLNTVGLGGSGGGVVGSIGCVPSAGQKRRQTAGAGPHGRSIDREYFV